jgi:hypothetical protein
MLAILDALGMFVCDLFDAAIPYGFRHGIAKLQGITAIGRLVSAPKNPVPAG